MISNPKVQSLVDAIIQGVQEISQTNRVTARELLEALAHLIASTSQEISSRATTLNKLAAEEQTILALMNEAIKPFFEGRRQHLISQLSITSDDLSKDQVLEKLKQMLYNNTLNANQGQSLC